MSTLVAIDLRQQIEALTPLERAQLAGMLARDEAVRDKSYQDSIIGQEVATFLRYKRKRLTAASERSYESRLDKFARYFAGLELQDLEPPVGGQRVEEFLDHQWGTNEPGTYNVGHAICSEFFKWARRTGRMHGNPMDSVERAKPRKPHRETFGEEERIRIIAAQDDLRDRIALRLLFDYGLRKGALQRIQFRDFDHVRKRVTIKNKGQTQKARQIPLPDPAFWQDLGRHIIDVEAQPHHYLMASTKVVPCGKKGTPPTVYRYPEKPMSDSAGMHRWWYRCLERAGIVAQGATKGERMHKARHTAGQRVLDATGDLKLVQKLLGHESIRTTGDIYVDYDIDEWAAKLANVLREDER